MPDWTFLIAFSFFRIAAIAQGVYKRSLDGNASNPERARQNGEARAADGAPRDGGDRGRRLNGLGRRPRPARSASALRQKARHVKRRADPAARPALRRAPRRGGRVVDRAALEMRSTRKRTGGSNPSLSARN